MSVLQSLQRHTCSPRECVVELSTVRIEVYLETSRRLTSERRNANDVLQAKALAFLERKTQSAADQAEPPPEPFRSDAERHFALVVELLRHWHRFTAADAHAKKLPVARAFPRCFF